MFLSLFDYKIELFPLMRKNQEEKYLPQICRLILIILCAVICVSIVPIVVQINQKIQL